MKVSFNASPSRNNNKNSVIFLHGVGSSKEGWRNQRDCIIEQGWQYLAIDAPGFGKTPLQVEVGFESHIDAVLSVMDELGVGSAILCGHSLGGMTAQKLQAAHPNRVEGLILSATSPAFGNPDGDFQKQFLKSRFEPFEKGITMPEFAQQFSKNLVGSGAESDVIAEIANTMSKVSIDAYKTAMRTITTFDNRENLASIDVPTLLIAGEEDNNAPAKMMAKMATKIPSAQFVQLDKIGHMAPIENPAAFNHHIADFLKRF